MSLSLDSPIQYVPRVGPAMAEKLEILEIRSVRDLLYHIPFRYNDYSLVSPIGRVQPGETVTIRGTITNMDNRITRNGRKIQEAVIADDSGNLSITWFNQPFLTNTIKPGVILGASGTVGWFGSKLVLESPEYEVLGDENSTSLHTGRITPVYHTTDGVGMKWLRGRVDFLLESLLPTLTDPLPETIRTTYHLLPLADALKHIHFPESQTDAAETRTRLAFDELFFLQLSARYLRHLWETTQTAPTIQSNKKDDEDFFKALPFELTGDQKNAITDMKNDLSRSIPMNRLLEGDVGSGKTVVAAYAMYTAWKQGYQSMFMAPTQILAEQHFKTLSTILEPLGVKVGIVTGAQKAYSVSGIGDALVGTHALLSETVKLDKLGLVVIDEQQRFGVKQRQLLRDKGSSLERPGPARLPHLLTMTATPIPRTITLTMYGNLDLTTITESPKGRQRVKTWLVPTEKRSNAYNWIREQLHNNNAQAFIVCPLIDASETLTTVKAVNNEYKRLQNIFKDFRLGLLHGRMKSKEKTDALDAMNKHDIDILVTTPVVEVGIDISNATIILIEAAERFGLAQLHQLRGRVGRGTKQSYCLLFTEQVDEKIQSRLKALEKIYNGPELAELDLTLRGPGEVLGIRQHGLPELKIATFSDTDLIAQTQKAAITVLAEDPTLETFPHLSRTLRDSIIKASD